MDVITIDDGDDGDDDSGEKYCCYLNSSFQKGIL